MLQSAGAAPGRLFFSETHVVCRDREDWIITPRPDSEPAETPEILVSVVPYTPGFVFTAGGRTLYVDAALARGPFTLRPWKQGDLFFPLGMNGKRKKISDLLIDRKMPLPEKRNVQVLLDAGGEIVWVVGIRADHRFRVRPHTKQVAVITLRKPPGPDAPGNV